MSTSNLNSSVPRANREPSTLWAELGADENESVTIEMELSDIGYRDPPSQSKSRHVCEKLTRSVLSVASGGATKDEDYASEALLSKSTDSERLGMYLLDEEAPPKRSHMCERLTRSVLHAASSVNESVESYRRAHDDVENDLAHSDAFPPLDTHRLLGSDTECENDDDDDEGQELRSRARGDSRDNRDDGAYVRPDYWMDSGASNLDLFFTEVYEYYREHGAACIVASRLTDVITLGFTIAFSTFLFLFVKWKSLLECDGEDTCESLESYISFDSLDPNKQGPWEGLVWMYFATLTLFWLWKCLAFFPTCLRAYRMRSFYQHRLRITTRQLETMKWNKVVERICRLQQSSRFKIQINKQDLNAHDIASRIMRKENFVIGMFNRNVFNLTIPFICSSCQSTKNFFLTKHLEWNLNFCIVNHIFDDSFAVREDFLRGASSLRLRFRLMAIVNVMFLPFILVFTVVHFFLKNAEELHSTRDFLGPREWSPMALWRFREFNELRHVFEDRMRKSAKPADKYVKQFQVPLITIISRCVAFVVGAFLALLLTFTLLDENILLHVEFLDRNLLWWIAIFSGIIALSRSFIPKRDDAVFEPEIAIRDVAAQTHFLPPEWIRHCRSYEVHESFLELYQYKMVLLMSEVASLLVVPLVLWFSLPRCADDVIAFVRDYTTHVDGLGHVCSFSQFNLRKHGHPQYVGSVRDRRGGVGSKNDDENTAGSLRRSNFSMDGKMEKSFLNFKSQHPDWDPSAGTGAAVFLHQLSSFRMEVLAREQRQALERSKASSIDGMLMSSTSIHTAMSRSMADSEHMSIGVPVRDPGRDNCFSWLDKWFEQRRERSDVI
eukprot:g2478.t1